MMTLLQQRLTNEMDLKVDNDTSRKHIISQKQDLDKVYLNWGMTRSQGLLEMKVRIAPQIALLIQIQGKQYRHAIELCGTSKSHEGNWENVMQDENLSSFFEVNQSHSSPFPFGVPGLSVRPAIAHCNKYGDEFLYQYVTIPDNSTIGNVLSWVISDYQPIRLIGTNIADQSHNFVS